MLKRPLKVFLCHSSADKEKVREVYRYLKKQGIHPWLDTEELLPGQDWALEIPKALEDSDAIIIFLSKGSVNKEGYVQKEIKFALDRALEMPEGRIFIIPARLEPCDLPRSLSRYQRVDLYEEGGSERLLKALRVRGEQLERADVEPASGEEAPLVIKHSAAEAGTLVGPSERISKPRKLDTSIIVALIGVVGTIVAATLGSPLIEKWLAPAPSVTETVIATFTVSPIHPTETFTPTSTDEPPLLAKITDAKGVTMLLVPRGSFIMGSESGDDDERPVSSIILEDFYIDEYEVTNKLYKNCFEAGICLPPMNNRSRTRSNYFGRSQFDDYPVIHVTWIMARTYCEWRGARLPTEAEWEKAARGTEARTYPWGEGQGCNFANYGGVAPNGCVGDTNAVGSYESGKSIYDLYDMAGNVWEWVSSRYQSYPYNFNDGRESDEPWKRVFRGGSWNSTFTNIRTSFRSYEEQDGYAKDYLGFRCAKDAP